MDSSRQEQALLQQQLRGREEQVAELQEALRMQQDTSHADAAQAQLSLHALHQQMREQAEALQQQAHEQAETAAQAQAGAVQQLVQQVEEGVQKLAAVRRQCAALQRQAVTDRCR